MAYKSFDELITPMTSAEIKAYIYAYIEASGTTTSTWKPGASTRTVIAIVSAVLAAFSTLVTKIARLGFLDLSEGDWLTVVAKHQYGVYKNLATSATGEVTLTNAGGGVYSGSADDLVFSHSATGKTYRNSGAYSLGALGTTTIGIYAVEAGSASSAAIGTITVIESGLPPTLVTCTNADPLVGTDEESDPSLRNTCRSKQSAVSPNGPKDAYNYFAKIAKRVDGSLVGINRTRVREGTNGSLTVYVATPTGVVSGTEGDPNTDLGAVAKSIWENAEPQGITATIESVTTSGITVAYDIYVYNDIGMTDLQIRDAVENALNAWWPEIPISGHKIDASEPFGYVYPDTIRRVIGGISDSVYRVVLSNPIVPVPLGPGGTFVVSSIVGSNIYRAEVPR